MNAQESISNLDALTSNVASKVFFDFTKKGALDTDLVESEEAMSSKNKSKAIRELF